MTTTIKLKPEYVKAIEGNPALLGIIAQKTGRSHSSIMRWCKNNSPQLTLLCVLYCIRDYLQLNRAEELTEHSPSAPKGDQSQYK